MTGGDSPGLCSIEELIKRGGRERCTNGRNNKHPSSAATKRVFQREVKWSILLLKNNAMTCQMLLYRRANHFFISVRGNLERRRSKAKGAFHFAFECFVDHRRLTS
jgi:hypothetical protein